MRYWVHVFCECVPVCCFGPMNKQQAQSLCRKFRAVRASAHLYVCDERGDVSDQFEDDE